MDGTERFILESQLFSLLDPEGRRALVAMAEEVTFPTGHVILKEGERGDAFYVTVSGRVRVAADSFGIERHLATLGEGAIFGEIAALTAEPRTATVFAEGEVRVLRFDATRVRELLKGYPKVLEVLNRIALRRSEETLEALMTDDLPEATDADADADIDDKP